jgi:hypothetical protein
MPGLLSGSDCYRGCRSDHHASWGGEWRGGGADGTGERDHGVSAQSRRVRGPLRVASGSVPGARDLFTPGSAPGYETTTIQMEVTGPTRGLCGCSFDSIEPSTVSIAPTVGAAA